ncbi:MAG: AraC family transcriptional regulator [Alistipes sp.]|nr:AraC family transcriptional regulator [Alistipes sp.]
MAENLTAAIENYLDRQSHGNIFSIDDEFGFIENPSFDILPNHPYRSPMAVAVFCTGGRASGRLNARSYNIEEGGFFIVQQGQITELLHTDNDFRAIYLLMTPSFTESLGIGNTFDLSTIIAEQPYIRLEGRAREALEGYLTMCRNLLPESSNPHRLEILRLLTRAFFLGLGYFVHNTKPSDGAQSRQSELTSEFIGLVEKHYRSHRNLRFYADKLGLTSKHISMVVKQSSGKSAMEWIEKYVILDATVQLTSTDRTIKEIAYDLHFPSQSFFGKYFCRVVGISPTAYRNKYR